MEQEKKSVELDEVRLADIDYHKKQNSWLVLFGIPGMLFAAILHYYLTNYFESGIFVLMIVNAVIGLILGHIMEDLDSLILLKRVSGAIAFLLLAVSLLTGLLTQEIFLFLPWLFVYSLSCVIFFGRWIGSYSSLVFSIAAIVIVIMIDIPQWNSFSIMMLKLNTVLVLLSIWGVSVIAERIRAKVQDDLAVSENQHKIAELKLRQINTELQIEIERRRESENALLESEKRYRDLFEESVVPLWEEDWSKVKTYLDGLPQEARNDLKLYFSENPGEVEKCIRLIRVMDINRATMKLYSIETKKDLFENLTIVLSPFGSDFMTNRISSLFYNGKYSDEVSGASLEGKPVHLLVSSNFPAGYEKSWKKVFSSVYDETERVAIEEERKRIEMQMQNARQNQAIGTLAGGIAHEFNNALSVIYGNLDLLELRINPEPKSLRFMGALKDSAGRMSRLTDQLLAYAEGGKYLPQQFSVNDLIRDLISSRVIPPDSGILVTADLKRETPMITGDITQIKMVLGGVFSNSIEALNKTGEIKISTAYILLNESLTGNTATISPGEYSLITVEDNGAGMSEEALRRIFEPFFTTKIHGRGMGMAAAFGIVRNHDGMITVDSRPGIGTIVKIYLPSSGAQ